MDEEKDGQSEKSLMAKESTKGDTSEESTERTALKNSIDEAIEGAANMDICDKQEEACKAPARTECCRGERSVIKTDGGQRSAGQCQGRREDGCGGSVEYGSAEEDKNGCHVGCGSLTSWGSIEDCAGVRSKPKEQEASSSLRHNDTLEYLDFSGCYKITDMGLR